MVNEISLLSSEYNGQNVDEALAQLKEQGVEMKVEDLGTMTLSDGKNVTVSMMGETKKGTYELKGDTLTITSEDGQTGSATIKVLGLIHIVHN